MITGIRRVLPCTHRIGGALVVLAGLYVGYYGVYELRLYHGDGSSADPIVDGAGELQSLLASWADQIGPFPLLVALLVLVGGGALVGRRFRRGVAQTPRNAIDTHESATATSRDGQI